MYEFEPKVISFATGDNEPLFDDHEGQYVRKPEVFEKGGSKLYGRVLNDTRKRLQCYLFFNRLLYPNKLDLLLGTFASSVLFNKIA